MSNSALLNAVKSRASFTQANQKFVNRQLGKRNEDPVEPSNPNDWLKQFPNNYRVSSNPKPIPVDLKNLGQLAEVNKKLVETGLEMKSKKERRDFLVDDFRQKESKPIVDAINQSRDQVVGATNQQRQELVAELQNEIRTRLDDIRTASQNIEVLNTNQNITLNQALTELQNITASTNELARLQNIEGFLQTLQTLTEEQNQALFPELVGKMSEWILKEGTKDIEPKITKENVVKVLTLKAAKAMNVKEPDPGAIAYDQGIEILKQLHPGLREEVLKRIRNNPNQPLDWVREPNPIDGVRFNTYAEQDKHIDNRINYLKQMMEAEGEKLLSEDDRKRILTFFRQRRAELTKARFSEKEKLRQAQQLTSEIVGTYNELDLAYARGKDAKTYLPVAIRNRFFGRRQGAGLRYYNSMAELEDRLSLLIGARKAGNHSIEISNEAMEILDILLNNKKMTKQQHKKLFRFFLNKQK